MLFGRNSCRAPGSTSTVVEPVTIPLLAVMGTSPASQLEVYVVVATPPLDRTAVGVIQPLAAVKVMTESKAAPSQMSRSSAVMIEVPPSRGTVGGSALTLIVAGAPDTCMMSVPIMESAVAVITISPQAQSA